MYSLDPLRVYTSRSFGSSLEMCSVFRFADTKTENFDVDRARSSRSFAYRPSGLRKSRRTEIASSTSMEIRYVNPRFLPAFILMPPHSMLIDDERLRTGRRLAAERKRERKRPFAVAVAAAVATAATATLLSLSASRTTSVARSLRVHVRVVKKSRTEPTCNCNRALLPSGIVPSASDRYVVDVVRCGKSGINFRRCT